MKGRRSIPAASSLRDPVAAMAFALTGPIVGLPGYEDVYPVRAAAAIRIERLQQLMGGTSDLHHATDAEVAGYLSCASLIAPMPREWAEIYRYAYTQAARRHGWPLPAGIALDELDSWVEAQRAHLAAWLRRRAWERFRARLVTPNAETKSGARVGPDALKRAARK